MKKFGEVTTAGDGGADGHTARLENDRLWPKVWQVACREEEIPQVGDYVTYDALDESIIVTRSAPDKISAYYNVCQHRGPVAEIPVTHFHRLLAKHMGTGAPEPIC